MNVVIPLAGISNSDPENNFYPIPLREIGGKPLIQHTIENLKSLNGENEFIYIVKEEDCIKYHLDNTLKLITPNCKIKVLKNSTRGAVCSILMAADLIEKDKESIIVNADQLFNTNLNEVIKSFRNSKSDAGVITFQSVHPRWSYVICDENNEVFQAEEKNPISKFAIAGFYYFKTFDYFIDSAFRAIEIESFYNNSLYTSALLNQMVLMDKKVVRENIDSDQYFSFYSKEKINEFTQFLTKQKK